MNAKMKMRMLSLLLCFVMLVGLIPTTVWAAEGPDNYYGRNALSALTNSTALLYAYDQLAAGVETSAETITVYNGTNAITQSELEMVMDAYRRDYAHHFWFGNSYTITSNADSVVSIKPTYSIAGTNLETAKTAFEQKVTNILSGITSSMSEYEKELYLHDKLAEIVTYEEGTNAHNAYGALVEGKAVCEGYAEALQYLLQRVGIQSFLAVGTSINPTTNIVENHEWNYVKIDGKYYHLDLTWDDQGENLFHAYFNQTDTVIREDHTISTTGYALPVCDSTEAQYFTGKDEYLDIYTADTVGQLLKDNDLKVHVYIPGTVNDFISWYATNIADIGTKAGITGGFSYGYAKLGRELILNVLPDSVTTYTVTVTGGTASPAGPYTVGTEVTVTADPDPEGKKFKEWQIEGLSTTTSESRSIFFYMPANNVTITAIYEDANIIIESTNATITEPVVGANPDFNIVSADESKYTVTVVKWNLLDGSSYPVLTAGDKFVRGESYQLDVKFVANPGYEFSDSCVFNVNGVPSAAYSLTKGERRCTFDVYEIIDTINVKGVVAPVAGATPDVSGITSDTDGINVMEVKWRDKDGYAFEGDPFVAGEKYILWLKYETESGYKVADDAEVAFNISDSNILDKKITHPIIKMTYEVPAASIPTTYTVSFDANGGTGTMTAATVEPGEYELPTCTFTAPSGKQFKAWSVGGVEKAVGDKITVTADTTVTAVWESVSEYTKKGDISAVEATATIDPALGATTSAVSFTITEPTDAAAKGVIISGTSWYKKDASSIYGWTQCSNGVDTFEEGTYRLSVQLRSKSNDDKEYYAMSDATTFTVNGVQWNSEEPFRDNYATSGYGYRFFVSPEFTLGGKTLNSIAITTPPTKTVYREGEDFNPAGMVVTATYTDSTTAPVVLYTVTDGSALTAGKTSVTISYTEGGVTKNTTQAITVAKEYTVTVNGGTGNGKKIAGEEVTISAFVSTGMQFKEWQGTDGLTFTSGDKNSQTAIFTMPAHDVTVTAVTGPAEYYVSVSGGSGTGMYETGEIVTIVADPPEAGKQFKTWSVGDGKVLRFTESDITSSTAKFIMPGEAVRIYATYEDIPAPKTPIDSVNISDLAKPVVGEMPDNDVAVIGAGVTVDDEGSYWGRFVSPSFSPVYDDDTAVDSVVFREGETYMFQLYLNAAAGYEFTADSKFYFASELLPAPDMTDLSKSFAMVNPSDSTQAVIYINMNDIAHVHVPGDWDFNDTHHWHKCTASGCDAGADVSRLPDYAEHSFVNGLCTCGAHKHSWSADWSVNGTHHWHECSANGCTVTNNSGKDGYVAHDFTAGACVCGVENVITSIEISGITTPVAGATPVNSASVDKVGAEVNEENTFWVRYDASAGNLSDTYTDGTFVYNTPFRDGEIYLLQITIKPKTGYSFTADTKLLYGGTALSAPDAANPTASCGAIAPDCSMAMALINPTGASAPLTYTVSFVANGGTGTMADVTVESGAEYTLPANGFTAPAGKQFKAWSVGGVEKAVGDKITVTANTTVTAVWKDIPVTTYTVSFAANGGTGTMADATGISGEYELPACTFTAPSGKQFKAWSVGGAEKAVGDKITVTANTTVTAVWEDIPVTDYTVTFDSNGGSAVAAQTVAAGQKAAKPTDPVKNGYIFKGWKLDGSTYDFNTAVNKNITLVAVWEEDNSFMDDWYWALIMLHSQKFDITAAASEGGKITPEGVTKVQYSKNMTYAITPDAGYAIKAVFVDGKDVGAVSAYTFKNVTKKHTIHALFEQINPYTDVKAGDWFYDDVLYVTAMGLMEGTGNGKFSPEITTDRAMLVTVLWRLEGCPVVDSPVDFFDVADGLWYSAAIDWASAYGIVNGYGDGRFGPTDQITREQIAAILNRYAAYKGWTDSTALPMLAQYKCSDWAESNVIWAENNGLLDGLGVDISDMTAKASRAELAAYLHKFMKNIIK